MTFLNDVVSMTRNVVKIQHLVILIRMMKKLACLLFVLTCSIAVVAQKKLDKYGMEELANLPEAPDYSNLEMWAGHPDRQDAADLLPGKRGQLSDNQAEATVDVFFVHPTIYTGKPKPENPWNADLKDKKLNKRVNESTIKNQATVFNGTAKVYAPRYRQAHYNVFLIEDLLLKQQALDNAYMDVREAFEYYLEHWNQGRNFIIASHSQGTLHAARLIKEFIEDQPLQQQMVAAYLIGMPLQWDLFEAIIPCKSADDTGCWITWNTYAKDYYPPKFRTAYHNALSVNPLNWQLDETYAPASKNLGGVLRNYGKIHPELNDAQNHKGLLWISKPKFFGNFLFNWKRYHVADYNLFYMNIRENVARRVAQFQEAEPTR